MRSVPNVGRGRVQNFVRFGAELGRTCARAWTFGFNVLYLVANTGTLLTWNLVTYNSLELG